MRRGEAAQDGKYNLIVPTATVARAVPQILIALDVSRIHPDPSGRAKLAGKYTWKRNIVSEEGDRNQEVILRSAPLLQAT
jgi:hypothetical protein